MEPVDLGLNSSSSTNYLSYFGQLTSAKLKLLICNVCSFVVVNNGNNPQKYFE